MNDDRTWTVTNVQTARLDVALTEGFSRLGEDERKSLSGQSTAVTRAQISKWIREGRVSVDGEIVRKPGFSTPARALLVVSMPAPVPSELLPDASVPFSVCFEDDDVIVVDKPPGVVTHPGAGCAEGTLVHGLLAHVGVSLAQVGNRFRPGVVHRLDRDTSGLLVLAKTQEAYYHLARQFLPPRTVSRTYLAIVGKLPKHGRGGEGAIDLPLGRDIHNRTRMSVRSQGGRQARTTWRIVEPLSYGALLDLTLETGRTHQIRVHLQAVGAPIFGDRVYGMREHEIPPRLRPLHRTFGRQALHAHRLSFLHPRTQARVEFTSPVPADFEQLLNTLRKDHG